MKRNNGYQFRAFELNDHEVAHEEEKQVVVIQPPKHLPRRRTKAPAWQVEAFEDSPKKKGLGHTKAPKSPKGKPSKQQKTKAANSKPHFKGFGWFASKPKAPEVSPMDSGGTTVPDILAPASTDFTNRDYIVVDGTFHAYLYITGYGYNAAVTSGWLSPLVEMGEGINLSFTVKRQQKDKILPQISQSTMVNRSRMRDVGDTRQDYEELDSAISSGLWMKDEMNRNGEDFYYMHTLIEVTADDADTLEQRVSAVETRCTSMNMVAKRCDYKHEQAFLSSLPLANLDPDIERKSRRNALTTGVAAAFPFSSFEICDQSGIMLGINLHNRSVCMLDIFDSAKYSNANLSIAGMSGAGKTMLLQTMALRLREQNVQIFIIAPLKGFEFRPACEAIGGRYIKLSPSSADCINIMEIRRSTLDVDAEIGRLSDRNDSLLADKIAKLHIYFSLLKPNITDEERHYLDAALVECYAQLGISFDNDSLYDENGHMKPMPDQSDLYKLLQSRPETKGLATAQARFVTGSASNLGRQTNVDLTNKYIVLDISEMPKDLLPLGMFLAVDFCWDKCKESRVQKKALMLDELWCLIGASSNPLAADYVLEIFKTIRGFGGSAVCATQDLNDFFALENGKYGKGIINNSRIKVILPLEEDEALRVKDVLGLSDEETLQIIRNRRGEGLLCAGHNRISVAFQPTQMEYDMITTSRADLEAQMQQKERTTQP